MKELSAYIQPRKLNQITMALTEIPGFPGMSDSECEGFGREHTDHIQDYKPFLPRTRLEIFAPESLVEIILQTIMRVAHSGHHGDGNVYIIDSLEGGRISTGERDGNLG